MSAELKQQIRMLSGFVPAQCLSLTQASGIIIKFMYPIVENYSKLTKEERKLQRNLLSSDDDRECNKDLKVGTLVKFVPKESLISFLEREQAQSFDDTVRILLLKARLSQKAYERTQYLIRNALYEAKFDSMIIDSQGIKQIIPPELWGGEKGRELIERKIVEFVEGTRWRFTLLRRSILLDCQGFSAWLESLDPVAEQTSLASSVGISLAEAGLEANQPIVPRGTGRPSIKALVLAEFSRRVKAGTAEPVMAREAQALWDWAKKTHPALCPTRVDTVKRHIRSLHKRWKESGGNPVLNHVQN